MPVPVRVACVGAGRAGRLSRALRPGCPRVRRQHVPQASPNEVPASGSGGENPRGFRQQVSGIDDVGSEAQAQATAGAAADAAELYDNEDEDEYTDDEYTDDEYYSDEEDYYSDEEEGEYYSDDEEVGEAAEYYDDDAEEVSGSEGEYSEEGEAEPDEPVSVQSASDVDSAIADDAHVSIEDEMTEEEKFHYLHEETEEEILARKQRIIANRLQDERATIVEGDMSQSEGWEDKVVQLNRVTKVLRGGKLMKFRAVVVSGNYKGSIGYGVASAREVVEAVQRASKKAKANAINVPMVKGRTFPHKLQVKVGAARIMLRPAAPGTGVIAGGAVRIVLELAGYQNAFGKILGTGNAMNNTRGTIAALQQMFTWKNVAADRDVTVDFLQGLVDEPDEVLSPEERQKLKDNKEGGWQSFRQDGSQSESDEGGSGAEAGADRSQRPVAA